MKLAPRHPTRSHRIGDVVRAAETDFRLVECFDPTTNTCTLSPSCRLKQLFNEALLAYFRALDGATLGDMTKGLSAAKSRVGSSSASRTLAAVEVVPVSRRPRGLRG